MSNDPVIYEVNLTVPRERAAEFDVFLDRHIREMLALPGFLTADIARPDIDGDDSADDAGHTAVHRTVQYRLENRHALDEYLRRHAERMRADGVARFGDDLRARRRILSVLPQDHPADEQRQENGQESGQENDKETCTNCGATLLGQYCAACGQRHRTRMISVFELLRAAFDDILSWDSRVWRTLRPLLLSPGKLTAEYLGGRRVHYTPPLRMYLVLSVAFFLISALPSMSDFSAARYVGFDETTSGVTIELRGETTDDADEDGELTNCELDDAEINLPGVDPEVARAWLKRSCNALITPEGRQQFLSSLSDLAPKLLIVLLPIIALVGKLFYVFSRRYYVEHLLFYTHLHSFGFLLLIVDMLLSAVSNAAPALPIDMEVVGFGSGIYAVYYLYRGLRVVFAQGRVATLFKMMLIFFAYVFLTSILLLIGTALATLSL